MMMLHVIYLNTFNHTAVLSNRISDAFADTLMWSSVDVNVGIICACLPVLQPVIQRLFGNLLSGSKFSKYANHMSRQGHDTHNSAAASAASTAPFRRLDEDVIGPPPRVASNWLCRCFYCF